MELSNRARRYRWETCRLVMENLVSSLSDIMSYCVCLKDIDLFFDCFI